MEETPKAPKATKESKFTEKWANGHYWVRLVCTSGSSTEWIHSIDCPCSSEKRKNN